MKRFFGVSKNVPGPTLEEAGKRLDGRMAELDDKINKLNQELMAYDKQMKSMRPGPAQNSIKQKAIRVLQTKKMYEKQRDQLSQQSFNVDQTRFVTESMKDTITTVSAMKQGAKEMKTQLKQINIDDVDDLQDQMQDLLDYNTEIQDSLSRAYMTPDTLDDSELEAELMSMGEEMELEMSTPSYLLAPSVPTGDPQMQQHVDEYGLPQANSIVN
ncbi:SNF7 family protein [Tieghemostelium lacteum]|uniref:SNF7 family protein n=1 Tax=Tieghemostelium lacteum TaxID=361077 RepID=A0A151Z766_TIELA|nr:SNF7 family protein [Tieghemostelium lacteum]|eukprot:KYQ89802.1 SNF7 family protein [Tieghemostelium lacteum]